MGLIWTPPGIQTKRGYAPADIARSAAESAYPGLWADMVFAFLPGIGRFSLVNKNRQFDVSGATEIRFSPSGPAAYTNRSSYILGPAGLLDGASDASITARFTPLAFGPTAEDAGIFGNSSSTTGFSDEIAQFVWRGSSSTKRLLLAGSALDGGSVIIGAEQTWLGRKIGTYADFYSSDDRTRVTTNSVNATYGTTQRVIVGSYFDLTEDRGREQSFVAGLLHRRSLSEAEQEILEEDIFAPFRRRPLLVPVSVSGGADVTGTADHQAQSATHSATGIRTVTGASSHQAQAATHTATGAREVTGDAAHQSGPATHTATGLRLITGTASHQAEPAQHSASGNVGAGISGTASHQAEPATHAATGLRIVTGTSAHQSQPATHTASGTAGSTASGTAAHQASPATHTAAGLRIIAGGASHQAQPATHTASGALGDEVTGTASHQAQRATHNATGLRVITGSGANVAGRATHAAVGLRVITGSASHQAQPATHEGTSRPPLGGPLKNLTAIDISTTYRAVI